MEYLDRLLVFALFLLKQASPKAANIYNGSVEKYWGVFLVS